MGVITDLVCSWRCPVSSFIMVVYGQFSIAIPRVATGTNWQQDRVAAPYPAFLIQLCDLLPTRTLSLERHFGPTDAVVLFRVRVSQLL